MLMDHLMSGCKKDIYMRTTERPLAENEIMVRIMNVMERKGIRQKDLMERIGVSYTVF